MRVIADEDLGRFLERVGGWLDRDPLTNNLMNTLLRGRYAAPELMLSVEGDDGPQGVAIRTPGRPMIVGDMPPEAADALAKYVAAELPETRILIGPSAMIGDLAGQIAHLRGGRPRELRGSARFTVDRVIPPAGVGGAPRIAAAGDRDLLVEWTRGFLADVDEIGGDPVAMVDERLGHGLMYVWTVASDPVAMACETEAVAGVIRINLVYTPAAARRRGYASALTAHVAQRILDAGHRPMLFTDLGNPTSNKIYQEIGFRKLDESQMWEIEA